MISEKTIGYFENFLVPVTFDWTPEDPSAVTMTLSPEGQEEVVWILSRHLLRDGTISDTGEGDVTLSPTSDTGMIRVSLASPYGAAEFDVALVNVQRFVTASFDAMNAEAESAAIETGLDEWLATL